MELTVEPVLVSCLSQMNHFYKGAIFIEKFLQIYKHEVNLETQCIQNNKRGLGYVYSALWGGVRS